MTRKQAKRRADIKGISYIAISLIAVTAAGGWMLMSKPHARDRVSSCRTDGHIAADITIVVDRTDHWGHRNQLLLPQAVARLAEDIPPDGRLKIATFDGTPELNTIFDACNPGAGSTVSWFANNPKLKQKEYEHRYLNPLSTLMGGLATPSKHPRSYLVELLSSMAASQRFVRPGIKPRLVLFSDLHENSPSFSFYKGVTGSKEQFADYVAGLSENHLDVFDIEVWYVRSEGASLPHEKVRSYWKAAFESTGVSYTWKRL